MHSTTITVSPSPPFSILFPPAEPLLGGKAHQWKPLLQLFQGRRAYVRVPVSGGDDLFSRSLLTVGQCRCWWWVCSSSPQSSCCTSGGSTLAPRRLSWRTLWLLTYDPRLPHTASYHSRPGPNDKRTKIYSLIFPLRPCPLMITTIYTLTRTQHMAPLTVFCMNTVFRGTASLLWSVSSSLSLWPPSCLKDCAGWQSGSQFPFAVYLCVHDADQLSCSSNYCYVLVHCGVHGHCIIQPPPPARFWKPKLEPVLCFLFFLVFVFVQKKLSLYNKTQCMFQSYWSLDGSVKTLIKSNYWCSAFCAKLLNGWLTMKIKQNHENKQ